MHCSGSAAFPEVLPRRGLDRRARREHRQRLTIGRALRRLVGMCAVAAAILWVSSTFLVQGFSIPSSSMTGTLQIGDRVLVSRLVPRVSDVARGDIVVFTDPGGWSEPGTAKGGDGGPVGAAQAAASVAGLASRGDTPYLVKRVIGTPGDRVECGEDGSGRITVNGVPLDESYLGLGEAPSETGFDVVVPDDHLFVLGDHRAGSADSRSHQNTPTRGFVPIANVVGTAVAVYWPVGRATPLPSAAEVFREVPPPDVREALAWTSATSP